MKRARLSLDGVWQFWIDEAGALSPADLAARSALPMPVPAPWQAQPPEALGGLDLRACSGPAWYRRAFDVPAAWLADGGVVVVGFGAVDYCAEVWVNESRLGEHEGGYLPFDFDATAALRPGANTVTVRVTDPTELFAEIPHGKQGWYGPLSGLWQSVWLERRPARHLTGLRLTPREAALEVEAGLSAPLGPGERLRLEVTDPDGQVCARAVSDAPGFSVPVPDPQLWDLDQPRLYTARVRLEAGGEVVDALADTFGFRTIAARDGRLYLNGRPLYLRGALDQDYYPDLICTPPSLEHIEETFRQARAMGLNCVRVHIKVADPRYYQAADRVGLLVWTEVPNWSRLTPDSMRRGREVLAGMIARDWNHPSIVIWTIVNEAWGTELAINPEHSRWLGEIYDWAKGLDPTRLFVDNSACAPGFHVRSDIDDYHFYATIPDGAQRWDAWIHDYAARAPWIYAPAEDRSVGHAPLLVSEFGQWGLPEVAQLYAHYGGEPWWFETGWDWGPAEVYPHGVEQRFRALALAPVFGDYAGLARASQRAEYEALKYEIETLRLYPSLAGYVVTELTDVHWECNGLLDMLRRPKVFAPELPALNADTLLIPRTPRAALRAGETAEVALRLSHVGAAPLREMRLAWELTGDGVEWLRGERAGLSAEPWTTVPLEPLRLTLPQVMAPAAARLNLRLRGPAGEIVARTHLDLSLFPDRPAPPVRLACEAPALAAALAALGYALDDGSAAVRVVTRLDAAELRRVQEGGRTLFLAETPAALEAAVPRLVLKAREGTVWADTAAATFAWFRRDRLGGVIPGDGVFGHDWAAVIPETVIALFGTREFEHDVLVGMCAGWLRYGAALTLRLPLGRGVLVVTTLKLREALARDPLAAALFDALVGQAGEGRA